MKYYYVKYSFSYNNAGNTPAKSTVIDDDPMDWIIAKNEKWKEHTDGRFVLDLVLPITPYQYDQYNELWNE